VRDSMKLEQSALKSWWRSGGRCRVGARAEGVVIAGEMASGGMMSTGGRCVAACLQALGVAPRRQRAAGESCGKLVKCSVVVLGRGGTARRLVAEAGYSSVPKALPFMRQLGRHDVGQTASTMTKAK
jgi:hypothetical protein